MAENNNKITNLPQRVKNGHYTYSNELPGTREPVFYFHNDVMHVQTTSGPTLNLAGKFGCA